MSGAMLSDLLPHKLNINGISARDGVHAFAGININFADTEAYQSQSIIPLESIFTLILPAEWGH
jgi:hypothetical protein